MTDLYQERPWWTREDHASLLSVCRRLRPQRVLEFGPGGSTLTLVEAGVPHVDSFEDHPIYLERAHELLDAHPAVRLHSYRHEAPLAIDGRWDLGFVDGPRDTSARALTIEFALDHCRRVFVHDAWTVAAFVDAWFMRHGTIAEVRR